MDNVDYYQKSIFKIPKSKKWPSLKIDTLATVDKLNEKESINNETKEEIIKLKMSISLCKRIDHLINDVFNDDSNIKSLLIEIRMTIDGSKKDKFFVSGAISIKKFLDLFEKSYNHPLTLEEYGIMSIHICNIVRFIPHYTVNTFTDYIKSGTSRKIYDIGSKNAPFESYLEKKIIGNPLIPDPIENISLSYIKTPGAILSGTIDGTLDFIKGSVDAKFIPDKAIAGLYSTIKSMPEELQELNNIIITKGGNDIVPDLLYISSYILSIIYLTAQLDPTGGIIALVKSVGEILKKLGVPINKIDIIQENIVKHSTILIKKFIRTSTIAKGIQHTTKVYGKSESLRSGIENTDTLVKQIIPTAKEALSITKSILSRINSSIVLSSIFSDDIEKILGVGKNTSIALSIYKNNLNKGKKSFILEDIDNMIKESSGELKYNLIRIKERFKEVKIILNTQIKPVYKKYKDLLELGDKDKLVIYKEKIKKDIEFNKLYDKLAKNIITNYIL